MRHLRCSTQALEIFVCDLAGLKIAAQPLHRTLYRRRSFSAQVSRRNLNSTPQGARTGSDLLALPIEAHTLIPLAESKHGQQSRQVAEEPGSAQAEQKPRLDTSVTSELSDQDSRFDRRRERKLKRIQEGKANKTELSQLAAEWHAGLAQKPRADQRAQRRSRKPGSDIQKHQFRRNDSLDGQRRSLDTNDEPVIIEGGSEYPKAVSEKHIQQNTADRDTRACSTDPRDKNIPTDRVPRKREQWQVQKTALTHKFGDQAWQPRKRVSPDTLEGIRALHASDANTYTTEILANHFEITPEAVRRILKSKWKPNEEEAEERMKRWEKRGLKKWEDMAEKGLKPPKRWRAMGVPNPKLETRTRWEDRSWQRRNAEESGSIPGPNAGVAMRGT